MTDAHNSLQAYISQCFTGVSVTAMLARGVGRERRNKRFGLNLKRLRLGLNLNQTELAGLVGHGVKQPDVSGWEKGGVPALDRLVKLGEIFGSLDRLVEGINPDYDALRAAPAPPAPERLSEEKQQWLDLFDATEPEFEHVRRVLLESARLMLPREIAPRAVTATRAIDENVAQGPEHAPRARNRKSRRR